MEQLSTLPAVSVEGRGVQDAHDDDACSICLESFSDSDPSAVTNCKHEFHLQCVLEWCQRSSQCPMCWQAISMKDPISQELLEAIQQERNVQEKQAHTTPVFRLGDLEILVDADDSEIEERILQHLAAAAATGRSHRRPRREARSNRPATHGHPQRLVFSATDETTSGHSISSNPRQEDNNEHSAAIISALPVSSVAATEETHVATVANGPLGPNNSARIFRNPSSLVNQGGAAGPSDVQSFSETLKSRLQSASTRYRDSITKNTRGWKERWFTDNNTISNFRSEVKREVTAGIAAVSRMMEQLETWDSKGPSSTPAPNDIQ